MKLLLSAICCLLCSLLIAYDIVAFSSFWRYFFYTLLALPVLYLLLRKQPDTPSLYKQTTNDIQSRLNSFRHQDGQHEIADLQAEVNFKNKELATLTMNLVERGRLLSKVKEELISLMKTNDALKDIRELKVITRMLGEAEEDRNDWEQFSIHFDETHRNFLSVLKSRYPVLSTTDLKLCAYLKLNLSSKEIAHSMNITLKGVEVSRYRLRKKLNIAKEVNLFDFLIEIAGNGNQSKTERELEQHDLPQGDELANFLSFFNKSMTAKFISQGGYDFTGEGIVFKGSVAHNKG